MNAPARVFIVVSCLIVLAFGRDASAQQYPPAPIGPLATAAASSAPVPSGGLPSRHATTPVATPLGNVASEPQDPAVLGTVVRNAVVPNLDNQNDGGGALPRTGFDFVVLVAWGLILIVLGRSIGKVVRDRRQRRADQLEQNGARRNSRNEVPLIDTGAFVARDSRRRRTSTPTR